MTFILYLTKQALYQKVDKCRCDLLHEGLASPFTIERICEAFSNIAVEYIPFKTKGLRGMVVLATDSEPIHCILINSLLPAEEKRFHSMHEFMHIVLHSNEDSRSFNCYDKVMPNQNAAIEWQANEGAAELIMPYKEFIPMFSGMYDDYTTAPEFWKIAFGALDPVQAMAKEYFVSVPVIQNRISTLSYEIDQYRSGVPLDQIHLLAFNKQQSLGISVTDYVAKLRWFTVTRHYFGVTPS